MAALDLEFWAALCSRSELQIYVPALGRPKKVDKDGSFLWVLDESIKMSIDNQWISMMIMVDNVWIQKLQKE